MKTAGLFLLAVLALSAGAAAPPLLCPAQCVCSTTNEGLHKAVCSSTLNLNKFSLRNKHHNINIIDLSNSSITKINGDLDRFTEVVSIDLSYNKIEQLEKLLKNSKKLVHLNLTHNVMKKFSASSIPSSVSSLDLTSNLFTEIPLDLNFLRDLEHLEMAGNPFKCSCENLKRLNTLRSRGVMMDKILCFFHSKNFGGVFWKEVDIVDVCAEKKSLGKNYNLLGDIMLGDQPADTEMIGDETTNKKSMQITAVSDLGVGEVWENEGMQNDDDAKEFIGVSSAISTTPEPDIDLSEGSGDDFAAEDITASRKDLSQFEKLVEDTDYLTENSTTEEPEGSGDDLGSGMRARFFNNLSDNAPSTVETYIDDYDGSGDDMENITTSTEPFITGLFNPFFYDGQFDHNTTTSEPFVIPDMPTVFQGKVDWDATVSEETSTKPPEPVEEILTKINIGAVESGIVETSDNDALNEELLEESKEVAKSSVGTYVCIGILIFLLVGLIGLATIKSQIRKKNTQRVERQQKKDIEKAGREMVDMNKSLLGKPVIPPNAKKVNGSYELVPTHDGKKKNENGNLDNRKSIEENIPKSKAPEINAAPNGSTNKPNVSIPSQGKYTPVGEPPLIGIFPERSEPDGHKTNGNNYSDMNLLPPPHESMPLYQPDSGRVIVKMTETPKPKTPVLVIRSRDDGKIITTPSLDQSPTHKNAT